LVEEGKEQDSGSGDGGQTDEDALPFCTQGINLDGGSHPRDLERRPPILKVFEPQLV
jgi:hypothetical protein